MAGGLHHRAATLLVPRHPPPLEHLPAQALGQGFQVAGVVHSVAQLRVAQGPARPVRLLRILGEGHVQELLRKGGQPDLFDAQQLRRDHGVEHLAAGPEALPRAQQAQVVVGAVQDQPLVRQDFDETAEVQLRQRIDDEVRVSDGELDQADLLRVVVQAVGFGIQRHRTHSAQALHQAPQRRGFANVDVLRGLSRSRASRCGCGIHLAAYMVIHLPRPGFPVPYGAHGHQSTLDAIVPTRSGSTNEGP